MVLTIVLLFRGYLSVQYLWGYCTDRYPYSYSMILSLLFAPLSLLFLAGVVVAPGQLAKQAKQEHLQLEANTTGGASLPSRVGAARPQRLQQSTRTSPSGPGPLQVISEANSH